MNVIEKVNTIVLEGVKKEGILWFKPWKSGGDNAPLNYSTNTMYNGFNIFILNAVMKEKDYLHNQWLTYKQAQDKNGNVKKGEKSTTIFFWKVGVYDEKTKRYLKDTNSANASEQFDGKPRFRKTFSLRYYNVFNISQCDGLEPMQIGEAWINDNQPIEIAQSIVDSYIDKDGKLQLVHEKSSAFYNKSLDLVNMPKMETFIDSDSYYKTLFHELAHSTGHESRLNRKTLNEVSKWGDNSYAKEELVAEIASMYMIGYLGLNPKDGDENSQAYIKGWTKHLVNNIDECVSAMQQATKAVELIRG